MKTIVALMALVATAPIAAVEELPEPRGALESRAYVAPYFGVTYDNLMENLADFYAIGGSKFGYNSKIFSVGMDIGFTTSGRYEQGIDDLGEYRYAATILLNEGKMSLDVGNLVFVSGVVAWRDAIDSPYSLFLSSEHNPKFGFDLTYEDDLLFFTNRWILLNVDSRYGYADHGANLRTYGLKFGGLRIGVQESVIYTGRAFAPEYFLSPFPVLLTQLALATPSKQLGQEENANVMIGLMSDLHLPRFYAYGQLLVDDLSLDHIVNFVDLFSPWRFAWSFGVKYEFEFGTLGLLHAGSLQYVFQETRLDASPSYTLVPDVAPPPNTGIRSLHYLDNYLGYLYGENNLVVRLIYEQSFDIRAVADPIDIGGGVEYVVSGSKSPGNPWHERDSTPNQAAALFDRDSELEHTLRLLFAAELPLPIGASPVGGFEFFLSGSIGFVFNELELRPDPSDNALDPIFKPVGDSRLLGELFLGILYLFPVGGPAHK